MTKRKDPDRVKAPNKPRSKHRGKQIAPCLKAITPQVERIVDRFGNPKTDLFIEQRRLSHNASYNLRYAAVASSRALISEHNIAFRRDNIVIPIVSDILMIDYLRQKVNLIVTPTLTNQPGLLSAMYSQAVVLASSRPKSIGRKASLKIFNCWSNIS